jgi:hypothetical protein
MRKEQRPDPSSLARGETLTQVIFRRSRKALDRRALHVAPEPVIARWLGATCLWEEPTIGDHRFVVFSLDVAPGTQVYVQFRSEPLEPVLWEVSSGRWNPPADEWLAGSEPPASKRWVSPSAAAPRTTGATYPSTR